jgi:hypothetical protein
VPDPQLALAEHRPPERTQRATRGRAYAPVRGEPLAALKGDEPALRERAAQAVDRSRVETLGTQRHLQRGHTRASARTCLGRRRPGKSAGADGSDHDCPAHRTASFDAAR